MSSGVILSAKRVLDIEAKALMAVKEKLGESFEKAIQILLNCKGKVIVTGVGKSGHIARKMASTLSSTGTPSAFMHASESSHGDLGILSQQDVVIALSYGGASGEIIPILNYISRKGIPLIGIGGDVESPLAKASTAFLDIKVPEEACPLQLAPTASSTAMLAMGDCLAVALMQLRGFTAKDFAEMHPGGSLGFKLTHVKDLMHSGEELPIVGIQDDIRKVLAVMTHRSVRGAAGVLDASGDLVGIITDGGIRRHLEKSANPLTGVAGDLMSLKPRTIDSSELSERALFLMEEFQINQLFVLDKSSLQPNAPVGILHVQDLLRAKVR